MKFTDEITIRVAGGNGGPGCSSFLREKYRPLGGPDGGDGGAGGDVYIEARSNIGDLGRLLRQPLYAAGNGEPGRGRRRSGSRGQDLKIAVPIGTEVLDGRSSSRLADLNRQRGSYLAAKGGRGGRGNQHFATSVNRAPQHVQQGEAGEAILLTLRLKLLADVGLVGLPNSGKSTLLKAVSRKNPRIGDYPFTTLTPNIGVVENARFRRLSLADIPGIIAGASRGEGLGLAFLRHIERVRIIAYLLDAGSADLAGEIGIIRQELGAYDPALLERPALILLNKVDLLDYDQELIAALVSEINSAIAPSLPQAGNRQGENLQTENQQGENRQGKNLQTENRQGEERDDRRGLPVLPISAASHWGVQAFVDQLFKLLPQMTFAEENSDIASQELPSQQLQSQQMQLQQLPPQQLPSQQSQSQQPQLQEPQS